jgi:hypothetical protein
MLSPESLFALRRSNDSGVFLLDGIPLQIPAKRREDSEMSGVVIPK